MQPRVGYIATSGGPDQLVTYHNTDTVIVNDILKGPPGASTLRSPVIQER